MVDNAEITSEVGIIKISPDVVSVIASIAATEVKGVAGMSGGFTDDIAEKFGMRSTNKGIKVQIEGNETAHIDLYLLVEYGLRMQEIAWEVQQNVKKAVETMTGLKVADVNIHIQDIVMPREKKEEDPSRKTK
ncbi:Asp23/Gls24 family envelope stress response protein [Fonticella tunisiensis]|uniref:Putative alkaline shock family protein YloU n=1 Tax=Fonticella tunisiensis TaxID=1096341 RepID=A0A4R7KSP4_9CLOT|nr:Asp23/Gls24 family envelope stress response protein [Fonticella tunisiensis]TDT61946.1 putative alkaline shock family protein YloU [Fonticella tunisiensis]